MKLTKMSLVAALVIGSSAFAIENTKVSGNAQLFYQTSDAGDKSFFEAGNSTADIGVNIDATTDLVKTDAVAVSAGAGYTVLTTLGLENNLVDGVWGGAHTYTANDSSLGAKVDDVSWMREAWIAGTAGKTTLKAGRMALDTPIAFTETWTIEQNTFEAAVVTNEDIPDTTLIGGYIGNSNGTTTTNQSAGSGGIVVAGAEFSTFGTNGAYVIGAINNSFKPLTLQAWYYDLLEVATSYWLQADLACEKVPGLMAGVIYNSMMADSAGAKEDQVVAAMLGYEMTDTFLAKVAYSQVNSGGTLGGAGFNTATDQTYAQSKLYTEAWWNYGQVTMSGAKAVNVTVETPAAGIADLGLYVTSIDQKAADSDLLEVTGAVSKSFGPLDTSLVYIYAKTDGSDASNLIQAYLTLNF